MKLELEAYRQTVVQDPLSQVSRGQSVRRGGEEHGADPVQMELRHPGGRPVIVGLVADNELDLVPPGQALQISPTVPFVFARGRSLDVHDLDDAWIHTADIEGACRLQRDSVSGITQRDEKRRAVALGEGLATGHADVTDAVTSHTFDDVVQSVCRTFVRRAKQGKFELANRDSLWRLLCAITTAKTRQKVRFHGRQKRAAGRDRPLPAGPQRGEQLAGADQTPSELVAFADQMQHLLGDLDEEQRRVVELRLQERTYPEIAAATGFSKRTVRRIVKAVQTKWQGLLEEA